MNMFLCYYFATLHDGNDRSDPDLFHGNCSWSTVMAQGANAEGIDEQ